MYNEDKVDSDMPKSVNRESEISRAISKLHQSVEVAGKMMEDLHTKITPVLRNGLQDGNEKAATPEFSTKLAQDINNAVRKIDQLIEFIRETKERVEL